MPMNFELPNADAIMQDMANPNEDDEPEQVDVPCDKSWCHVSCADNHVLKNPKCNICKEYFILSPYYASIQSRIANHEY